MVRVWPFRCLHIGTLSVQGSDYDILEAMIDGLQLLSAQNSSSWPPKLRLLDLRQGLDCRIICPEIRTTFRPCFWSCAYSQNSTLRTEEAQHNVRCQGFDNSKSEPHSASQSVELLVDLSLGLTVDEALLSEVNTCVPQTVHLYNLRVSNIRFTCFTETHFQTFLNYLGQLDNLQELDLYALFLKDRLPRLLSVLPPQLKTLTLSYCGLSSIDVTILSQSSQATHLRQLNLSHNQIFSESHEPFQALLERASALSDCSCLRVLSFASNPIRMPMLMSVLLHLTSLMELKHVIYPVPLHCYRQWDVCGYYDQQKLAEVQAQLKAMLQAVQRDDMQWTSHTALLP
ncbi:melanoma antigen preferentially expressed in tumors-like [Manis javanica]|uniref:melanoma antigen preferentially expressed in tumors-like n=1 Tax=Manis javanica TaxID=9974 RepID=UPI003C6D0747